MKIIKNTIGNEVKVFAETFEKDTMNGIYTTSVNNATIDEAPQVYKPIKEIMKAIEPTADVVEVIKPIYNFKAN